MRAFIILPLTLIAVVVIYIAANPSGQTVGQAPITPTATERPLPTATPTLAPLPDGLSGRLTYRTGGSLVTVKLPEAQIVARDPSEVADVRQPSADGLWRLNQACDDVTCTLSLFGDDGDKTQLVMTSLVDAQWSPGGHTLALVGSMESPPGSLTLFVIDDPNDPAPRVVSDDGVTAFTWLGDGQLLFASDGEISRASMAGGLEYLAQIAAVSYLHPSPDGRTVAFTQSNAEGWHLWTIDLFV
jgi:hypothetical protein